MKRFCFIFVFLLSGCGKKESPKPVSKEIHKTEVKTILIKEPVREDIAPEVQGQYIAKLAAINPVVSGKVNGAFTFSRDSDELILDIRFNAGDLTSNVFHKQTIRSGYRCPTEDDDLNQDGFIDAKEGEAVYGNTIIPVDGDLNAQHLGLGTWPVSNEFGSYIYSQSASYRKFLSDIMDNDINPNDGIIKLASAETFQISNKVILIQGVSIDASLPETVYAEARMERHESFPIACGLINHVEDLPGIIYEDLPVSASEDDPGGPAGMNDGTFITPPPP